MANLMTPEHKVMIYQSLLKETEDAAVHLVTSLAVRLPCDLQKLIDEFDTTAGDGIDPLSKLLRRSAQALRGKLADHI